ncbi:MAG: hypothetical protein ACOX6N_05350, partial [Patescibacteria group bacterium]
PEKMAEVAKLENLSRSAFEKAGLPRMPAKARARFVNDLREAGILTPEGRAQADKLHDALVKNEEAAAKGDKEAVLVEPVKAEEPKPEVKVEMEPEQKPETPKEPPETAQDAPEKTTPVHALENTEAVTDDVAPPVASETPTQPEEVKKNKGVKPKPEPEPVKTELTPEPVSEARNAPRFKLPGVTLSEAAREHLAAAQAAVDAVPPKADGSVDLEERQRVLDEWKADPANAAVAMGLDYGVEIRVGEHGVGGESTGGRATVGSDTTPVRPFAADWTKRDAADFQTSREYPQNQATAAHEIVHSLFSRNPQTAHAALESLISQGVPRDQAFESLVDLGGLYLLEPRAITDAAQRRIIGDWLDAHIRTALDQPPLTLRPDGTLAGVQEQADEVETARIEERIKELERDRMATIDYPVDEGFGFEEEKARRVAEIDEEIGLLKNELATIKHYAEQQKAKPSVPKPAKNKGKKQPKEPVKPKIGTKGIKSKADVEKAQTPKLDINKLIDEETELVGNRDGLRSKLRQWADINKKLTDGKRVPKSENPFMTQIKEIEKKLSKVRKSIYEIDPSRKPVFGQKQKKESFGAFFDAKNQDGEYDLLQWWHQNRGLFGAQKDKGGGEHDAYRRLPKNMRQAITWKSKGKIDSVAKELAEVLHKPEYADTTGPDALVSDWVYQYNAYQRWKEEGAPSQKDLENRQYEEYEERIKAEYEREHEQEQRDLATYRQMVDNGDVIEDGHVVALYEEAASAVGIDPAWPFVNVAQSYVRNGTLVYEVRTPTGDTAAVEDRDIDADLGKETEVDNDIEGDIFKRAYESSESIDRRLQEDRERDNERTEQEEIERETPLQGDRRDESEVSKDEGGKSGEGKGRKEDLNLESATPEELAKEARKRADKKALEEGAAKQLTGTAGDLTPDMFGEGDTPLFNERRDTQTTAGEKGNAQKGPRDGGIKNGAKVVATAENGVVYSGEMKGYDSDGKAQVRAFKEKKKGAKKLTPYPIRPDGTLGFKDVTVPAESVRQIDVQPEYATLTPEERYKLKVAREKDAKAAEKEIRAGEHEAPTDVVDRFNASKESKEQRRTDNHDDDDFQGAPARPGTPSTTPTGTGFNESKKLVNVGDVVAEVKRMYPTLTIHGKATFKKPKYNGWYSRMLKEMRTKDRRALSTIMHELGHYFDDVLNRWSKTHGGSMAIRAELLKLGRALYGDTKPKGGYKAEGFAEFIRMFLTGDGRLKIDAPETYNWFMTEFLPANPEEAKKILKLERMIEQLNTQTPQEIVEAFMNPPKDKWDVQRVIAVLREFNDRWVDKFHFAWRGMKKMLGDAAYDVPPEHSPFMLMHAFNGKSGRIAYQFVVEHTTDLFGNKTGESMVDALSEVNGDKDTLKKFRRYAVARVAQIYHKNKMVSGIDPAIADAVVAELDSPMFQNALERFTDWTRRILHLRVEAGLMTQKEFDKVESTNPVYIKFMRHFLEHEIGQREAKSKGLKAKRRKGGTVEIEDPIAATIMDVERTISDAMQGYILKSIVWLYDQNKG